MRIIRNTLEHFMQNAHRPICIMLTRDACTKLPAVICPVNMFENLQKYYKICQLALRNVMCYRKICHEQG